MRVPIPLAGSSKQDRVIQVSNQRSINVFPSIKTPGAKSDLVLYSHPGLIRRANVGIGPHRANPIKWKGNQYWISGSELFKQDTSLVFTSIGTILTSGSRVIFAKGRNYLMFVDGTYGYYTDGSTVTRITDADFPGSPTHCAYLNGYFIVNDNDTDDFYINETREDPTAWSALDFATADASPDKGLALDAYANDLYIFGEDTTQRYFNSGNNDFPFEAYPGALPAGIQAPYSLAKSAQGLFWLGVNENGDYAVLRAQANSTEVISDEEWTWKINKLSNTSDAIAWVRRQGGLSFYEITFPSSDMTWSYCIEHGMPSELKSYGINRFRGNGFGFFNGRSYVGSYNDGLVYELDFDTYTDDTNPHIRTRVTRVIHKDGLSITFRSLTLDAEAGIGLMTGQGSDPMVMMRYSVDGGRTWSSELWRSLGKIGKPETKPQWNDLGEGNDWVFEFSVSDPVSFSMINLFADIDIGRY